MLLYLQKCRMVLGFLGFPGINKNGSKCFVILIPQGI